MAKNFINNLLFTNLTIPHLKNSHLFNKNQQPFKILNSAIITGENINLPYPDPKGAGYF